MNQSTLLIGADLVPTQSNFDLFEKGDAAHLVGDALLNVLSSASFRIFNLEVPLANTASPIVKCGPALIAPPATVKGIKALRADLLTLANNHILDQGEEGLSCTLQTLKEEGICYLGAGENRQKASKPYELLLGEKKIAIYACAEHEFSIAGENTPGANPYDPLETFDQIEDLKKNHDYVIVLYHGGKEYYRYPSPDLQRICRKMVQKGADLVVCQHSHCIGCEEKYQSGTIVYGQGNFLFDLSDHECWQTSLLIELDSDFQIRYIPLKKEGKFVRLAEKEEAKAIMEGFQKRSNELLSPEFIETNYNAFASSMLQNYLFAFSGMRRTFIYKVINKLSGHRIEKWIIQKKYGKTKQVAIQNFIECEAHRELLLRGLKNSNNR